MQREIKKAVRETLKRVALQLAASELEYLLRLISGAHDADSHGHRELVIFRCREGASWALMLSHNPYLEPGHPGRLREMAQDLEAMAHYLGKGTRGGGLPERLAPIHLNKLRVVIMVLTSMVGRMKSAALEASDVTRRTVQEPAQDAAPGNQDSADQLD
jgi:hypothetical protein